MGENLISAGNRDNDEEVEKKTREKSIGDKRQFSSPLRLLIFIPTWRGYANQRARVSSLVTGFTLVSLLVFSLFRPSLAVPRRMQQHHRHHHHQHHHHHHHHYQVKPLETHEGNNDNTLLHDDELETIRKSIVEGLGLERIPDPSKANVSQAEYERAHHEYMNRLQMSRAPGDRRQKRLYTFYTSEQSPVSIKTTQELVNDNLPNTYKLFFPMEISEQHSIIDYANLRLLVGSYDYRELVDITIYQLTNSSRHLFKQEYIQRLDTPRWIEIDITEMVTLWHEGVVDNLGLELQLNANIVFSNPILNVFTTFQSRELRKRRSASDHLMSLHKGRRTECRGDNKKCCRHEMTVIFKDLKGFEFIVQPKNFDAGYCKGRCPPRYNPAHHHALLQSLIWKEDKRKVPRPCCAPSKLAELEILYFDENDPTKLKVSSWKNMRVLECACS